MMIDSGQLKLSFQSSWMFDNEWLKRLQNGHKYMYLLVRFYSHVCLTVARDLGSTQMMSRGKSLISLPIPPLLLISSKRQLIDDALQCNDVSDSRGVSIKKVYPPLLQESYRLVILTKFQINYSLGNYLVEKKKQIWLLGNEASMQKDFI